MAGRSTGDKPDEKQTFEAAYQQLEDTVQALESGGLSLDQATKLYEEGTKLAKACNELLNAAELRISRLQTSVGEQMRFIDGDSNDDYDSDDDDKAEP